MFKTVTDFQALMDKYNIERKDDTVNHGLVRGSNFYGTFNGGMFANLSLKVTGSDDVIENLVWDAEMRDLKGSHENQTIRIYQRYLDNDFFSIAGIDHLDPLSPQDLMGNSLVEFTKLEKLLMGESITIREAFNPDRFITITMDSVA